MICRCFLPLSELPLYFPDSVLLMDTSFKFWCSPSYLFFFFSFFCCHVYKTIYSSFISWRFTLTFSSKTFTVLALTFRYLIIWFILSWFLCLVREVGVQLLPLACGFSVVLGFPSGPSGKEPACQCRWCKICGFDSWVRKIPWRRKWHPSILAWKIPWAEEPGGL